jgi:hypothetical protein
MKKIDNNVRIIDYVEHITEIEMTRELTGAHTSTSNDATDYQTGDITSNTLKDLDYNSVDTFLTKATYLELKSVMGDPTEFSASTSHERKKRQKALDNLNKDEYVWKTITKRTVHDPSSCSLLYPNALNYFLENLEDFCAPSPSSTSRDLQKSLPYKAKLLVRGLSESLVDSGHKVFDEIACLSDSELDTALGEIDMSWVFNDVVRVILKKTHDNTFNQTLRNSTAYKQPLSDNILAASKHSVAQEMYSVLAMYLMNLVLIDLDCDGCRDYDYSTLGKIIRRHLLRKSHLFFTTGMSTGNRKQVSKKGQVKWWGLHCDGVRTMLGVLEKSGMFKVEIDTKKDDFNTYRTTVKYVLPLNMLNNMIEHTPFPRICKADRITNEIFEDKIKPIFKGDVKVSSSDKFKATLNISKDKKYRINSTFLSLIEGLFQKGQGHGIDDVILGLELPFPAKYHVSELVLDQESLDQMPVSSPMQRHVFDSLKIQFASVEKDSTPVAPKLRVKQSLMLSNSSEFETKVNLFRDERRGLIQNLTLRRKMVGTLIALANVYKDFPIFITDSMCGRGRLYPEQPFISRTAGELKHLLMEYTRKKVTIPGFLALLGAYYKPCPVTQEKVKIFLSQTTLSKKNSKKELSNFFKNNPLEFSLVGDKICYFMLLHSEIHRVIKTGKTGICLEIDQVASGVMLLSYFLRNRKMAEKSNVLGGVFSDPYAYCQKQFKTFYYKNMESRNSNVFEFLCENRKVHKYAIMCFCYAQTHIGRMDDFQERWYATYERMPTREERTVLNEFAISYPDFIEFSFPGTKRQIELIYKAVLITAREIGHLPFRNLQGETFQWTFFKFKKTSRSSFDPISQKAKPYNSYKYYETMLDEGGGWAHGDGLTESDKKERRLVKDLTTFRRKALSYFIHCIDASLIHRYILTIRKKHGYTINHLHDCVLLHPNYVDNFFDVAQDIYSSGELYYMTDTLFFDHIAGNVSADTQKKINTIRKDFNDNSDVFVDELGEANARNIYQFEG